MQEATLFNLSGKADVDLTARRLVTITATGVNYPTAAQSADGVTDYDASTGKFVNVKRTGTVIVEGGGVIAVGAYVEVGANGKAVTAAAGVKVGKALTPCGADGQVFEMLWLDNS